jgi:hypothetical protein
MCAIKRPSSPSKVPEIDVRVGTKESILVSFFLT